MNPDLQTIAEQFDIPGRFVSGESYGSGHINDTYAVTMAGGAGAHRCILQRINSYVFRNPAALMDNIYRVTSHQHRKLAEAGAPDAARRALTLIRARSGAVCGKDAEDRTWRAFVFIEQANSYSTIQHPRQAYEVARAFGEFQKQVVDLPGPRLVETIPNFHHTPRRFEALEEAIKVDAVNRAAGVRAEIDFAMKRKAITGILLEKHRQGLIPERITHNDTKMNNVLLDVETNEGICVIDLDTVMPGLVLYDFGDMIRSGINSAAEDERDLSKVRAQRPVFEALVNGYLESASRFLTPTEREYLVFSGKLISFEIGIRFLTDYLSGDVYFKTCRPGQNLDRCRVQFTLIQSMEEQEDAMMRYVSEAGSRLEVRP